MQPSQVRIRVLSDHQKLRDQMGRLERMAHAAIGGETQWGELREAGEAFLAWLASHMEWEEHYLVPVLRDADSWGETRCSELLDEHREQRELLEYVLRQLRDENRPESVIASDLLDLTEMLRKDMEEEESAFLDDRVLRDDVVSIDMFSG